MITLLRRWYLRHFSQPGTIEFALVLLCAFIIVYYFMWLVGPLVVALCLAFCLDWPVEALSRALKIKRPQDQAPALIDLGDDRLLLLCDLYYRLDRAKRDQTRCRVLQLHCGF